MDDLLSSTTTAPDNLINGELDVEASEREAHVEAARATWLARFASLAGVLVPLGLMIWVAARSVLDFDGGMNMQVASSIAHGHGYAWDYAGHLVSPIMVQTSGPFIFTGALGIRLFGTTPLGLQFANLVFLTIFLVAVSKILRPWRWLHIVGPTALLLITPEAVNFGLGGFGEFAIAGLMLWSYLLLSWATEGRDRPALLCASAGVLFGISLTIKFIAIAALPGLLVGYAFVAVSRQDISRRMVVLCAGSMTAPIALFEAYRASQLGSVASWVSYWRQQLSEAHGEGAGQTDPRPWRPFTATGWDRILHLALETGVRLSPLVLIFLLTPLVTVAMAYRRRTQSRVDWLKQPTHSLAAQLTITASLYLWWYILVTPADFLRHLIVGWVALSVLYLLLAGHAISWLRERRTDRIRTPRRRSRLVLALALITVTVCISRFATTAVQEVVSPPYGVVAEEQAVSDYVATRAAYGTQFCGMGIEFASVVMVTSHVAFCDLDAVGVCGGDMRQAIDDGRVFVLWDPRSTNHYPAGPRGASEPQYAYTRVNSPSNYASIWRVSLKSSNCD